MRTIRTLDEIKKQTHKKRSEDSVYGQLFQCLERLYADLEESGLPLRLEVSGTKSTAETPALELTAISDGGTNPLTLYSIRISSDERSLMVTVSSVGVEPNPLFPLFLTPQKFHSPVRELFNFLGQVDRDHPVYMVERLESSERCYFSGVVGDFCLTVDSFPSNILTALTSEV